MTGLPRYASIRADRPGRAPTFPLDRPYKLDAVDANPHAEPPTIVEDAADDPDSDLIAAPEAARPDLINHAVPGEGLDLRVDGFADRLAAGAGVAIRAANLVLKALAAEMMDACLELEERASRSADHQKAAPAFRKGRSPRFTRR